MASDLDYWGNRFCGGTVSPITDGVWWVGWHDGERMEGVAPVADEALCALDHFLSGRGRAGKIVAWRASLHDD